MMTCNVIELESGAGRMIQDALNTYAARGYRFAMRDSRRRPSTAFMLRARKTPGGNQRHDQ